MFCQIEYHCAVLNDLMVMLWCSQGSEQTDPDSRMTKRLYQKATASAQECDQRKETQVLNMSVMCAATL